MNSPLNVKLFGFCGEDKNLYRSLGVLTPIP